MIVRNAVVVAQPLLKVYKRNPPHFFFFSYYLLYLFFILSYSLFSLFISTFFIILSLSLYFFSLNCNRKKINADIKEDLLSPHLLWEVINLEVIEVWGMIQIQTTTFLITIVMVMFQVLDMVINLKFYQTPPLLVKIIQEDFLWWVRMETNWRHLYIWN